MRLLSLALQQFRSFERTEISFSGDSCDLFIGPNGSGKTNILEAITFLSVGSSCLGALPEHIIRWGTDFTRMTARVQQDDGEENVLEVAITEQPRKAKAFFVNDVRIPVARFLGILPTVTFLPEDLLLFTGSPAERRLFIDRLLMQLSPVFVQAYSSYKKALSQRNILLRRIGKQEAHERDLLPWDAQLAEYGAKIIHERRTLLDALNATLTERVQALGESWENVRMNYVSKTVAQDVPALRDELALFLTHYRPRDLLVRSTTVGPHRDDWNIVAREHDIATFASRGQQRTVLLALLFGVTAAIDTVRSERPLVLLDDVFSELDDAHQHALLSGLQGHHVLMTTTHLPEGVDGVHVREVKEGHVMNNVLQEKKKLEVRSQKTEKVLV